MKTTVLLPQKPSSSYNHKYNLSILTHEIRPDLKPFDLLPLALTCWLELGATALIRLKICENPPGPRPIGGQVENS
jgi:hypothetical protein